METWESIFSCTSEELSGSCPKGETECVCIPIIKGAGWTGGDILALKSPRKPSKVVKVSDIVRDWTGTDGATRALASRTKLWKSIVTKYLDCSAHLDFWIKEEELALKKKEPVPSVPKSAEKTTNQVAN